MRKLIKIEQVNSNKKYDFIILGNCIDPLNKKSKVLIVYYTVIQILFSLFLLSIFF